MKSEFADYAALAAAAGGGKVLLACLPENRSKHRKRLRELSKQAGVKVVIRDVEGGLSVKTSPKSEGR